MKSHIFILLALGSISLVSSHVKSCCRKATGNCRIICDELTRELPQTMDPETRDRLVLRLEDFCPLKLIPLWKCINDSKDKEDHEQWSGRACCHLAETETCRSGCTQSSTLADLHDSCRYSDEVVLYDCAERKQRGEECCTMAKTPECHSACRKSLMGRVVRSDMETACTGHVSSCMERLSRPKTYYMAQMGHCCTQTPNDVCKDKCKALVKENSNDIHIIQEMTIMSCGPVSVQIKDNEVTQMWNCFLSNKNLQLEAVADDPKSFSSSNDGFARNTPSGYLFSPNSDSPFPGVDGSYLDGSYSGQSLNPGNNQYPADDTGSYPDDNINKHVAPYSYPEIGWKYPNQYPGSSNQHPSTSHQLPSISSHHPSSNSHPSPSSHYPSPHSHHTNPNNHHVSPNSHHSGPSNQHSGMNNQHSGFSIHPASSNQYPAPNDQFTGSSHQYPGTSNQYPGTSNQYPGTSNQYPGTSNQYPGTSNQYPGTSNQYPGTSNQYPTSNDQFTGTSNQFPGISISNQYPAISGQYPGTNNQYPGANTQFPGPNIQYPGKNNQSPGGSMFPGSGSAYPGINYPGSGNVFPPGINYPHPGSSYPGSFSGSGGSSFTPLYPGKRPGKAKPVSPNNIAEIGMDVNKLYCCLKSSSPRCRQLCHQSFSNQWNDYYKNFDSDCLENNNESLLSECLDDVDEPCELGCDGLHFCSSFNKKTDHLFRSCNSEAERAQAIFDDWISKDAITIPQFPDMSIRIKNITNCSPVMWKTVVCTLQVRPCTPINHSNKICREDCYKLLSSCLIPDPVRGIDAISICNKLSPMDENLPCISLENFLEDTKPPPGPTKSKKPTRPPKKRPPNLTTSSFDMTVYSPCSNNLCNAMQICVVNRVCNTQICPPYSCQPGCKLGEISNQLVPTGTYVSLLENSNIENPCFKMCQCSPHGTFTKCLKAFCINNFFCKKDDVMIDHGHMINTTCNQRCVCHWGDLVCDRRDCETTISTPSTSITIPSNLLCKSPPIYAPVCAWNGLTLPNEHLARCLGYNEYKPGACINPCFANPCANGETCIHTPRVCMFSHSKECPQYECMRIGLNCPIEGDMACSKDARMYNNTCQLLSERKEFDYKGPCLGHCSSVGVICGVDGVTYDSECQANARFVKMDYAGPCMNIGVGKKKMRCPGVKCPDPGRRFCSGYTPPGACCPFCGGAIKVAYSQKIIDHATSILGPSSIDVFTVENVVKSLERLIKVSNCRLFGHMSIDGDLVLLVVPISLKKTKTEILPCTKEAEKLSVLIDMKNPKILSVTSTSPLVLATKAHKMITSSAMANSVTLLFYLIPLTAMYFR